MERQVTFAINGEKHHVTVEDRLTLLQFLRERLGLVGAKNGCGKGHCGACTVIVDGKAKRACLLKAADLDGATIQTIEGLGQNGELHPLQKAFIYEGAIQCGFCTPGMIMAAKALLDQNPNPTEEEIKNGLRHNLCRCTGYTSIIRAVKLAARMLKENGTVSLEVPAGAVGSSVLRKDVVAKAMGQPLFTDDFFLENMLFGKLLLSPLPHAEIVSIDTDVAKKMPGVAAVLTAKDIPGRNGFGLMIPHQPVLADKKVRYVGDPVAVVYAETEAQAEAALAGIKVEYNPLPGVFSPLEGIEEGAPLVHEEGNILHHVKVRKGDGEKGFAAAEVIVEGNYYTPLVEHAYLEPEAGLAKVEEDGTVTVWTASQGAFAFRDMIAATLDLPPEMVRVIYRPAGGAFGGKEEPTVQIHCALGAVKTGRPVKMTLTREESIRMSTKRHAEHIYYKTGATKDGKLVAWEARIIADTGAYASLGKPVVFRSAVVATGPYVVPHVKSDAYGIYTNHPPGGAFRGFGSTQVAFAAEVQMDKLARALNMDPIALRRLNALDAGETTMTGQVLGPGVGYRQTLDAVEEALREVRFDPSPGKKIGVGIASAYKNVGIGAGKQDGAGAAVELTETGVVLLKVGATDMGQGSDTALAQIAAQASGIPYEVIRVLSSDTFCTPDGGETTASRQTFVTGNAVQAAAIRFKQVLQDWISREYGIGPEDMVFHSNLLIDARSGKQAATMEEVAKRAKAKGQKLAAEHYYLAPTTYPLPESADHQPGVELARYNIHFAYCFGTQAAVVEVDEETGEVKVLKVIAAHDVGRAIHPQNIRGQIEGSVVMGMGYGLSEEFKLDRGQVVTGNLARLKLPKITQTPEIQPLIIEVEQPEGPFGAKGMGELPINPTAPAIINAIYDAVGVRINSLPATREKILQALAEKNGR